MVPCNPGQHGVTSTWDQLCVPCGLHADMGEHVPVPAGLIEMKALLGKSLEALQYCKSPCKAQLHGIAHIKVAHHVPYMSHKVPHLYDQYCCQQCLHSVQTCLKLKHEDRNLR